MTDRPDYNKLEAKFAKQDKARTVTNSGRGQFSKGDAETAECLIDYKFTEKDSFSLNFKKFRKHELDAFKKNKWAIITVVFQAHNNRRLSVVDTDYLNELQELVRMVAEL